MFFSFVLTIGNDTFPTTPRACMCVLYCSGDFQNRHLKMVTQIRNKILDEISGL